MEERPALRVHIEGRVQGVGYRYWVVDQASNLGLDGWVRNCRDGSVEMVVSGLQEALDEILRRCRRGPSVARVERVTAEPETALVEPGLRAWPTAGGGGMSLKIAT